MSLITKVTYAPSAFLKLAEAWLEKVDDRFQIRLTNIRKHVPGYVIPTAKHVTARQASI